MKTTKTGKSPGSDGFPSEFYKVFWADISTLLLKAIKCAFEIGLLSISQRRQDQNTKKEEILWNNTNMGCKPSAEY